MKYQETLPDGLFSHHVESYWYVENEVKSDSQELEMFLPTCTFNIIFFDSPCYVKSNMNHRWVLLPAGAAFIGQTNTSLFFRSHSKTRISGIRFKPFAFANVIKNPLFQFNDSFLPLNRIFASDKRKEGLISRIGMDNESALKAELFDEFVELILSETMSVDERLRAQLNYIMERHGIMKVRELFHEFNTTKVTLHNHFVKKVGLSPKKVSQIWRMNRILQLKEEFPQMNLTKVGLKAGFYDQAHFIKDFKSIFEVTPKKFFAQKTNLIEMTSLNIAKRFNHQYDPRVHL